MDIELARVVSVNDMNSPPCDSGDGPTLTGPLTAHTYDIEDYYLAADVLERVRMGREQVHSAEEVKKELGLAD